MGNMRRTRGNASGIVSMLVLCCLAACGGPRGSSRTQQATAPNGEIRRVVLLSIDGLTPALLEEYLVTPESRAADRALHQLLGATPLSGGRVQWERALSVGRATTVLPALAEPAAATLLTGLPPRLHGVRAPGEALRPEVPTLYELIARRGGLSANAGFRPSRGAAFSAEGDDGERIERLCTWITSHPSPLLVTVRIEELALRLRAQGPPAAAAAFSITDQRLHQLLYGRCRLVDPSTLVVLTSGHGLSVLPEGRRALGPALLGNLLGGVPKDRFRPAGGLLRIIQAEGKVPAALSALDAVDLIVLRTQDVLRVYDPEAEALIPLGEEPRYPDLARRALGLLDEGDVLALVRREPGFDFASDNAAAAPVSFGGAGTSESLVPLIFAGPPILSLPRQVPAVASLEQVAATLLGALSIDPAALGKAAGPALSLLSAPVEQAVAGADQELRACQQARVPAAARASCGNVLERTQDRATAAQALRVLLRAAPASDQMDAVRIADWLARTAGAEQALRCPGQPGGLLVLSPTPERISLPQDLALPSDRRPAVARACPVHVPTGIDGADGHRIAAAMLRFTGAEVAVYLGSGAPRLTVLTPTLVPWRGPQFLGDTLRSDVTAEAAAAAYLHLARGLLAVERGLPQQATHHLAAARPLGGHADVWRAAFHRPDGAPSADQRVGALIGPRATEEDRWAQVVGDVIDRLSTPKNLVAIEWVLNSIGGFVPALIAPTAPGAVGTWTGPRKRAAQALAALWSRPPPRDTLCDLPDNLQRVAALKEAATLWEGMNHPALAALSRLALMDQFLEQRKPPKAQQEAVQALSLIQQPAAAWMRIAAAQRLLDRIEAVPALSAEGALSTQAGRTYQEMLRQLLRDEQEDHLPGDLSGHLSALLNPAFSQDPDQVRQTLIVGLQNEPQAGRKLLDETLIRLFNPASLILITSNPRALARRAEAGANLVDAILASEAAHRLGPDHKLVQSLPSFLRAARALLSNDYAAAGPLLRQAGERLGTPAELLDARRDALLRDEKEGFALLAPYLQLALTVGQAVVAVKGDDLKGAEQRAQEAIAIAQRFARAELSRKELDRTLGPIADLLAPALRKGAQLAFALLRKDQRAIEVARAEVLRAVGALDLQLPAAKDSKDLAEARRFLVLAEVLVRDAVYFIDVGLGGRRPTPAHIAALTIANQKMTGLIEQWQRPPMQSRLAYHFLTLAGGVQSLVEESPCLVGGVKDLGALWHCGQAMPFRQALQRMGRELEQEFPREERMFDMASNDDMRTLALDLLLAVLPTPEADLEGYNVDGAEKGFSARVLQLLEKVQWRDDSSIRPMLTFLALRGSGDQASPERKVEWVRQARLNRSAAFAGRAFFWDVESTRDATSLSEARQAVRAAQQGCPALAGQLDLIRASLEASARNAKEAYAALDRYLTGALSTQRGDVTLASKLEWQTGHSVFNWEIQVDLRHFARKGAYQTGLTWSTKQDDRKDWTWRTVALGTPAESVGQALLLRAWYALLLGDEGVAGRALSDLISLHRGMSARYLVKDAPPWWDLRSEVWLPDPLAVFWVGVLAEMHGHLRLSQEMIKLAFNQQRQVPVNARTSDCHGDEWRAAPLPKEVPLLLGDSRCQVPTILSLPRASANPIELRRLVHLRAQILARASGLAGVRATPEQLHAELLALGRRRPELAPAWLVTQYAEWIRNRPASGRHPAAALQRALSVLGPEAEAPLGEAAAGGYDCEIATALLEGRPRAPLALPYAERCGAGLVRLQALCQAANQEMDLDRAAVEAEKLWGEAERFQGNEELITATMAVSDRLLNLLLQERSEQAPTLMRRIAARVVGLGLNRSAVALRAQTLAIESLLGAPSGETAAGLLEEARAWGVKSRDTRYLKLLIRDGANAKEAEQKAARISLSQRYLGGAEL